ncbi:hypothetical protein ACHAPJ_011745 [Fusarium lateritium]
MGRVEESAFTTAVGKHYYLSYVKADLVTDENRFISSLDSLFALVCDWSLSGPTDGVYRVHAWIQKDIVDDIRGMVDGGLKVKDGSDEPVLEKGVYTYLP